MTAVTTPTARPLRAVTFNSYRDIHKGIRSELFAAVVEAGRVDPADDCGRAALAGQVQRIVTLLHQHAHHEDRVLQPVLETELPVLAERIAAAHVSLDAQMDSLVVLANAARTREQLFELYIELSAFTADYLRHQDDEERDVMPALEAAIGVEAVVALHGQIVGSMPPQELTAGLAVMFPAMNVDDRTELLGGIKANAPDEAFQGLWSLARSVLTTDEHRAVAARLGLA